MSLLRVLSPVKSLGAGRLQRPCLAALARGPQLLSLSSARALLPKMGALPCPKWQCTLPLPSLSMQSVKGTIGNEWPGGTLAFLLLHLGLLVSLSWVQLRAALPQQAGTRQTADTHHTLQICSFSLILIPTHKHFSYIHWLHYHCRSVINKLKGRTVIQFNLGKIFK